MTCNFRFLINCWLVFHKANSFHKSTFPFNILLYFLLVNILNSSYLALVPLFFLPVMFFSNPRMLSLSWQIGLDHLTYTTPSNNSLLYYFYVFFSKEHHLQLTLLFMFAIYFLSSPLESTVILVESKEQESAWFTTT